MKNEALPMNASASEAGLGHLVRQGDIGAFAALFDSHKATVYSLCRGSAMSPPDAEQLTQDIFLDAFRNLAACPKDELSDGSFLACLHSSAVNRIQMYERRMRVSASFLDHLVTLAGEPIEPHRTPFEDKRVRSRNHNDGASPSLWSSWFSVLAKLIRPRQPAKALS